MNLIALAPEWLLIALCILVAVAAVEDFLRLKISNLTSGAVFVLALLAATLHGWSIDIWQNVLISLVLLLGGTALFAAGKMGGGDVKLFAAVAFWTDWSGALVLVPAIFIAGGLLAIVVLSRRSILRAAGGGSKYVASKGVPYGVAIALGTIFIVGYQMELSANRYERLTTVPSWALQGSHNSGASDQRPS